MTVGGRASALGTWKDGGADWTRGSRAARSGTESLGFSVPSEGDGAELRLKSLGFGIKSSLEACGESLSDS